VNVRLWMKNTGNDWPLLRAVPENCMDLFVPIDNMKFEKVN